MFPLHRCGRTCTNPAEFIETVKSERERERERGREREREREREGQRERERERMQCYS